MVLLGRYICRYVPELKVVSVISCVWRRRSLRRNSIVKSIISRPILWPFREKGYDSEFYFCEPSSANRVYIKLTMSKERAIRPLVRPYRVKHDCVEFNFENFAWSTPPAPGQTRYATYVHRSCTRKIDLPVTRYAFTLRSFSLNTPRRRCHCCRHRRLLVSRAYLDEYLWY